jgi:hypothetical protein
MVQPLTQWPDLTRLHQRIRKPDRQRSQGTRCAKTAETGESVSLGSSRKREDKTVNERDTSQEPWAQLTRESSDIIRGSGLVDHGIAELSYAKLPFIALDSCVYSA